MFYTEVLHYKTITVSIHHLEKQYNIFPMFWSDYICYK